MIDLMPDRRKGLTKKVNRALPPGRAQALGVAHAKAEGGWTVNMVVAASLLGLVFLIALSKGIILIPGLFIVMPFVRGLNPPRIVAVTADGLLVFSTSLFSNGPKGLVCITPLTPLAPAEAKQVVAVGTELLTFDKKDYELLVQLTDLAIEQTQTKQGPPLLQYQPI